MKRKRCLRTSGHEVAAMPPLLLILVLRQFIVGLVASAAADDTDGF